MSKALQIIQSIQKYYVQGVTSSVSKVLSTKKAAEKFMLDLGDYGLESSMEEVADEIGEALEEAVAEPNFFSQARPLGDILGYVKAEIDEKNVQQAAERAYRASPEFKQNCVDLGEDPKKVKLLTVPWEFLREPLMGAYQAGMLKSGMPKNEVQALKETQCYGKGHLGWVNVPGVTVPLDLCGLNWRMSDWTRPNVVRMTAEAGVPLLALNILMDKEVLGDGIDGVVKPEILGLPEGTVNVYQNRAFVQSPDGTIVRLYKGLIVVHPDADNSLAYADGYGWDVFNAASFGRFGLSEGNPGHLHVYNMLDVSKFNPRCRYTLQGSYYQGKKGWERVMLALENLKLAASGNRLLEERMLRANVPLRALGGFGIITALTRLLKITTSSGIAKVVLPERVFKRIKGLEHIHDALTKTYTSKVTGGEISGFFAPISEKAYFEAAGGVGSEWALNRRPDLPTGACVQRHVLLGYLPEGFNCFAINSESMKPSGLDFDGDMACCFPPVERGGLYVCFNDLPKEEQQHREHIAGSDRKSQEKTDYENGLCRHAGQIAAMAMLGAADITARKFIDAGLLEKAWAMLPWIQASVDMQKRNMILPDPRGIMFMPKLSIGEDEITATQVLRALTKGEPEGWDQLLPAEKMKFHHQWDRFEYKLDMLHLMSKLALPHSDVHLIAPSPEFAQVVSRFGYELGTRMAQTVAEQEVYRSNGKQIPVMHQRSYPRREATPASQVEHPGLRKLCLSVQMLDVYWNDLKEAAKAKQSTSIALYAVKDGLLEVGLHRGILSDLARCAGNYEVFQMFADEQAFEEYFASDTTSKRVSSLFCVLDSRAFHKKQEGSRVWFTNPQPVLVGLHRYMPEDIEIERVPAKLGGGLRVTAKHCDFTKSKLAGRKLRFKNGRQLGIRQPKGTIEYVSHASNIQDALLELRDRAAQQMLKNNQMLHPLQLAVDDALQHKKEVAAEVQASKQSQPLGDQPVADCAWDDLGRDEAELLGLFGGGAPTPSVTTEEQARRVQDAKDDYDAAILGEFEAWGEMKNVTELRALNESPEQELFIPFSQW